MEKPIKLMMRNCAKDIKTQKTNINFTIDTLEMAIANQKDFIKKKQDEGFDENAIDALINELFNMEEALDKICIAVGYLDTAGEYLKF